MLFFQFFDEIGDVVWVGDQYVMVVVDYYVYVVCGEGIDVVEWQWCDYYFLCFFYQWQVIFVELGKLGVDLQYVCYQVVVGEYCFF